MQRLHDRSGMGSLIQRPLVTSWVLLTVFIAVICLLVLMHPVGVWAKPPPSETPNPDTWVTDGPVYSIVHGDGITYIGGSFTYVGPYTGSFAALSVSTGNPLPPYAHVDGGTVYAVAPDGGGGWYIGGNFNDVGGVTRNKIAHIKN